MVIFSSPKMTTGDLAQLAKRIQLVVEGTNQMANTYEYGQQGPRVHKIKNTEP